MAINIILISAIGIVNIKTEAVPRCEEYPEEEKMESFIIFSKILCFFTYKRPKIIA